MKQYIIFGALLVSAITSYANLHDTYEQSCARCESKGDIYKDSIQWRGHNCIITEFFIPRGGPVMCTFSTIAFASLAGIISEA
jgi:hypothetical protein